MNLRDLWVSAEMFNLFVIRVWAGKEKLCGSEKEKENERNNGWRLHKFS